MLDHNGLHERISPPEDTFTRRHRIGPPAETQFPPTTGFDISIWTLSPGATDVEITRPRPLNVIDPSYDAPPPTSCEATATFADPVPTGRS
jgi:hypothetical protein